MKRSQINQAIREMEELADRFHFALPPFCHVSPATWPVLGHDWDEVRDCRLGWDITDYGQGDFHALGFSLITLRNGKAGDPKYARTYAEKLLMLREGQYAPMHYHRAKTEDIINRGGGNLLLRLIQTDEDGHETSEPVRVACDGVRRILPSGASLRLTPGESVTLTPGLSHDFRVEPGTGAVLIGEVSSVNDDETDNFFREAVGRFPTIEEDEPAWRLLCSEYPPPP
ncbi:D-lyxose isomerase [anaerobic digester metagenome]